MLLLAVFLNSVEQGVALDSSLFNSAEKEQSQLDYEEASKSYYLLLEDKTFGNNITNWQVTIDQFSQITKEHPNFIEAPKSLYNIGKLYHALFNLYGDKKYLQKANQVYNILIDAYPNTYLADDALIQIANISAKYLKDYLKAVNAYNLLIDEYPDSSFIKEARQSLSLLMKKGDSANQAKKGKSKTLAKPNPSQTDTTTTHQSLIVIKDLQRWAEDDWSRIILQVSSLAPYKYNTTEADKKGKVRFYIDLLDSVISKNIKIFNLAKDNTIDGLEISQFAPKIVRVVINLNERHNIKVYDFENHNQYKIVIDITSATHKRDITKKNNFTKQSLANFKNATTKLSASKSKKTNKKTNPPPAPTEPEVVSISKALGLKVRTVVIDAGHGGKDPGAIKGKLYEKDIVLKLALKVKQAMAKINPNIKVVLTRSKDDFIILEDRTTIANRHQGDLFISLHANSSENLDAIGAETYVLSLTTNQASLRLAAIENLSSLKSINQLQDVLQKVAVNDKQQESKRLASMIQASLFKQPLIKENSVDLGVKQAPFIVLIGASMPSVLVEVGFLSNDRERQQLQTQSYLDAIAKGIAEAISSY